MFEENNDSSILPMIQERNILLSNLSTELETFGEMTNQSMKTEIELINGQSDFWLTCNHIMTIIDSIENQIKYCNENSIEDILQYNIQYDELKNQHSILENDLNNAKSMSRSIATKASIIRNKRITPLLSLIWSMTSKSFNAEILSQFDDLYDVLFQFVEKADNVNSNLAVLGILVNLSSSYQGRESLMKAFHQSPIPCIKKLFNNYELVCEPRARQLVLYLAKNISIADEMCIDLIREGCIKFCSDYLIQLSIDPTKDQNDFQVIVSILDTLISMKYVKTLNFYSQNDLKKLYYNMKKYGEPDLKILAKIKDIANIQEEEQQPLKPKRFGVKRIYS